LSWALGQAGAGGRLPIDLIRGGQRIVCEVAVRTSKSGTEAV
jgi:hypothetical protein